MTKPTVGLTGGIACGKSTVAGLFVDLGIPVVDADAIAREVVQPGTDAVAEIAESFGPQFLDERGALDRKKLGDRVFGDPDARAKLNAITHPRIAQRSAERMQELQATEAPYLLYEAALLVENGSYQAFAALIVVAADAATQLQRLKQRDGIDDKSAQARIRSQYPLEQKVAAADFVVYNDGSVERAREQVQMIHEALCRRFSGEAP